MTAHETPGPVPIEALLAHREWVRALARSLHADRNAADDLEQETWQSALTHPPRHAQSLRAWFASAVRHRAASAGRKARVRAAREAEAPPRAGGPSPDESVAAAELQTRIAQAVLDLDEPYRTTVVLRYFDGLEASEIASRVGVPVETVRTRLKRAVARLREDLGVDRGKDRAAWAVFLTGQGEGKGGGAAGAGAAVAATVGGVVMATLTTKLVVAACVVLAAGMWWFAGDDGQARPAAGTPDLVASGAAEDAGGPGARPRAKRDGLSPQPAAADPADGANAAAPPVATDAASQGLVVHGRVIDGETGQPVAGAGVSLGNLFVGPNGRAPAATAGADGRFRIVGAGLAGFEALVLRAPGYADCRVPWPWAEQMSTLTKGDAGDVAIHRGKRIAGRVVAADGVTPVADARLRLTTLAGVSSQVWMNYAAERGSSDVSGAFVLPQIPPSHRFAYTIFAVSQSGVGWTKLPGDVGRVDADGVLVVLRPGGGAVVTVRDEAGAPRARMPVVASPRFEPLGPDANWDVGAEAQLAPDLMPSVFFAETDESGVARFAALPTVEPAAVYDFVVRGTGGWSSGRCTIRPGDVATLDVVVGGARVRTLSGVIRRADGTPVAGATVRAEDFPAATKTTGPDGRYAFSGAVATWGSRNWVLVSAAELAPAERMVQPDPKKDDATADFVLRPAGPIQGRVVDQDGHPVAGVELFTGPDDASVNGRYARSDAEGRFALTDTSLGEWRLQIQPPPPQDAWESMPPARVRGGDADAVVLLRRAVPGKARVVLTVVDEAGALLAPDEVRFAHDDESTTRSYWAHGKLELGTGRVVAERVKPGRHDIWLHFSDRLSTFARVEVPDQETEIAVRVVVGRPARLRGRIELGDTGSAMPDKVSPDLADGTEILDWGRPKDREQTAPVRVATDGTFEFPALLPGRWRVFARTAEHVGEAFVDVPSGGDATCVIALTKRANVSMRLAGAPPSEIVETWFGREGARMRRFSSRQVAAGTVPTIAVPLEPGRWRWRVSFPAPGSWGLADLVAETQEGVFVVEPGETKQIDVPVRPR